MPKLENFANRVEIDGVPYQKNEIKPYDNPDDTVSIRYCMEADERQREVDGLGQIDFTDWTDDTGTPYTSKILLLIDLKNFCMSSGSGDNLRKTAFGELEVSEMTPIFQGSFESTVDNTELNTNIEENDGTITQALAMAVLQTSATSGGHAHLGSFRQFKYRPGLGGCIRMTALFETIGVTGAEIFTGIVDAIGSSAAFINGYTIGYHEADFGVQRWSADTLIEEVHRADWDDPLDGTISKMVLLPEKLNIYFIVYGYLGAEDITFWVKDSSTHEMYLFHRMLYANLNTQPSLLNPNFHFTLHVRNASTDNLILKSSSYGYFVQGKTGLQEIHQPQFSSNNREKTSVTTEVAIFTIRNKTTYAGKTNFISIVIESISASIEASSANNLGRVRLVKNATLGGVPSYADINTTDSVIEIDVAGTTVTDGKELFLSQLAGKNDRLFELIESLQIILQSGESLTLAGESANSATIDGDILWKELF